MDNILSIDLEDWHSLVHRRLTGVLPPPSDNLLRQVERLLAILEQHRTTATFFVLGVLAESKPGLVKRIAAQGHEIASHGYGHLPIFKTSPAQFKEETRRSKDILEDLVGRPVQGYRAAEFSIIRTSLWALEILAELGFTYDSSIFPMYHRRYGIPGFPQEIAQYQLPNQLKIVELPLTTFSLGKWRWSFAGGGYFRLTPLRLTDSLITRQNQKNLPVILYFHPYEFDSRYLNTLDTFQPGSLRDWQKCLRKNWLANLVRARVAAKLTAVLKNHRFITCREYLAGREIEQLDLQVIL